LSSEPDWWPLYSREIVYSNYKVWAKKCYNINAVKMPKLIFIKFPDFFSEELPENEETS